jgi:hypothetical protein
MSETTSNGQQESADEELERAREELARQLEVACATPINPTSGETTGQLRRLDDALLAAARTAEGMIALKQRARAEREVAAAGAVVADTPGSHVERIREFHDRNGCQWRAWAVVPGQASTSSMRNLGDLRNGWLAFESMSDSGKRRLANYPADWMTLSDSDLEQLLEAAAEAPARKRAPGPDAPSADQYRQA